MTIITIAVCNDNTDYNILNYDNDYHNNNNIKTDKSPARHPGRRSSGRQRPRAGNSPDEVVVPRQSERILDAQRMSLRRLVDGLDVLFPPPRLVLVVGVLLLVLAAQVVRALDERPLLVLGHAAAEEERPVRAGAGGGGELGGKCEGLGGSVGEND